MDLCIPLSTFVVLKGPRLDRKFIARLWRDPSQSPSGNPSTPEDLLPPLLICCHVPKSSASCLPLLFLMPHPPVLRILLAAMKMQYDAIRYFINTEVAF